MMVLYNKDYVKTFFPLSPRFPTLIHSDVPSPLLLDPLASYFSAFVIISLQQSSTVRIKGFSYIQPVKRYEPARQTDRS